MKTKVEIAEKVYDEILDRIVRMEVDLLNTSKQIISLPHHEQKSLVEITQKQQKLKEGIFVQNRLLTAIKEKIADYIKEELEEARKKPI